MTTPTETAYLVSATYPCPDMPGHELADPEGDIPAGLLDRPEVAAFCAEHDYSPENPNELMFLVRESDPGAIPQGYPVLTLQVEK